MNPFQRSFKPCAGTGNLRVWVFFFGVVENWNLPAGVTSQGSFYTFPKVYCLCSGAVDLNCCIKLALISVHRTTYDNFKVVTEVPLEEKGQLRSN